MYYMYLRTPETYLNRLVSPDFFILYQVEVARVTDFALFWGH